MNQKEKNEQEWNRKENWKWRVFYHCREDSRVWVPKKPKWCGWTLNFAHGRSYVWLLVLLSLPVLIAIVICSLAAKG